MSRSTDPPHEPDRTVAAIHQAGVGVWLNPLPLGELDWNANTKAHFHLPPDARPTIELFYERLHAEDRERVRAAVDQAMLGQAFDVVYRTVGPAGQVKWIHATGHVRFDAQGRATRFDGITLDITRQVDAQQQLRDFADTAPAILWVTEPDGTCTYLSRGWTAFTGQPEVAGLGFGWLDMVHPDDRDAAGAAFRQANEARAGFSLEHRLRRPDGTWRWVIDAGRPRLAADGAFLGFVGSVSDIHDRRTAEDALRRASSRYGQLLDSIDQGFCVIEILPDAQGRPADYRFLEANRRFEDQTGLHAPVGRTALELVPGLEDAWVQAYGQVAASGEPRRFSQGSAAMGRWFDVYAAPVGEPHERQVALLFQDISERIRGERLLRESEERYRAFVANSTEGIWRMEFQPPVDLSLPVEAQIDAMLAAGRFAECNETFARMYGFGSSADVLGRGLDAVMNPADPQVREYLRALVVAGYRASETESLEHDSAGRPLWFANSLAGVLADGRLVRAWGTQRDITDRKRVEAALRESDRRKDEFLATLAHELRNPLAPIRSAAEVLRLAGGADARVLRNAGIIGRQATHLARMIDDLMDVSRISRGKLELRLAPLDLRDAVHGALENTHALLQQGRHAVDVRLPPQPVPLVGDDVRLVQVVQNLLANAARYSPDGAPVRIELRQEGADAVLRIRDEGIGIAPDQLARVFEMFFQGGGGDGQPGGGLGIGLSLVQKLTELHGGTVEARSAGRGQGSEFLVRLPLLQARDRGAATTAGQPADASPRRVLVVDDNRDAAETLAEMLRLGGHEVQTAYDGVEGVSLAATCQPDVVVLDLGMPRLDGYGACRRLRAGPHGARMAVLALSGWGQPADVERATDAGFDGHLVKPVSPDALARCIEAALARRAAP